jgi:hypothetical protein
MVVFGSGGIFILDPKSTPQPHLSLKNAHSEPAQPFTVSHLNTHDLFSLL